MSRSDRSLLLLAALACAACIDQDTVAPTSDVLVVHAVLDASRRDQYVFVQRARGSVLFQSGVTNAVVTITTPTGQPMVGLLVTDTSLFAPNQGEPKVSAGYRISLDQYSHTLVPGGTYTLSVNVDTQTVTGTTVIPSGASSAPSAGGVFTRATDTLRLAWPRDGFAKTYQVNVSRPRVLNSFFADTSIVLAGTSRIPNRGFVFAAGAVHEVVVLAVDLNYYDYFRRSSDFLTGGGVINHLTGGIGVFGSVAPVARLTLDVR